MDFSDWRDFIFDASVPFEERCLKVYKHQVRQNRVLHTFFDVFGLKPESNPHPADIPHLPVRAFRDKKMITGSFGPDLCFKSSGTGKAKRSRHFVADPELYRLSIQKVFSGYFSFNEYSILAYLPGYTDNPESSLIWMVNELIKSDESGLSRFLPLNKPLTQKDFYPILNQNKKLLLFGAAFGLVDLLESDSIALPPGSAVIETGGMKTHRREIGKGWLRKILSEGFEVPETNIHSEYGMCELLSQCYAIEDEWFQAHHWVNVSVRKAEDPSVECGAGEEGKIAITDLANVHSCAFILTEDKGIMNSAGEFQVLGRWKNSDLRGCNFLIERE